jgi:peroxiredoxin
LCEALRLATFEVDGMRLVKRLTMIVRSVRIEHVLYPVFPPNESANDVLRWVRSNPIPSSVDPVSSNESGDDIPNRG